MISQPIDKAVKDQIVTIIRSHLKCAHYKLVLFGSRASGKFDERSDIDIGIEGARTIPLNVVNDIKDALDGIPIMQKIDLVDLRNVSGQFKEVSMQSFKVIYEQ